MQKNGPQKSRLISTNFDAGSSNLASERRETAGNPIFQFFSHFFAKTPEEEQKEPPASESIGRWSAAAASSLRRSTLRRLFCLGPYFSLFGVLILYFLHNFTKKHTKNQVPGRFPPF